MRKTKWNSFGGFKGAKRGKKRRRRINSPLITDIN
jgi:hypothetical protein